MLVYSWYVVWLSVFAAGMRMKPKLEESLGQAQAGQMLRERYQLGKFLERRTRAQATPGHSFPYISSSRRQFNGTKDHLGQGSFGDVWEAYDHHLMKKVAVKIFYQGSSYMTWRNADSRGRQELSESASECNLVKGILTEKHRAMYPIGASRICECYDEYISDSKGTSNIVFLVQEMCGQSLTKAIVESRRQSGRVNYVKARQATKQMLQAVAFLQMFDPPLIHHDLKPGNVCINEKQEIKVIDWGGLVFGTQKAMFEPAVSTPLFRPPEAASRLQSFAQPWWSYDAYALGLMHMMFICPMIEDTDWYYRKPVTSELAKEVIEKRCHVSDVMALPYSGGDSLTQDLELIADLANDDSRKRSDPMVLLDHESMINVQVPKISEDQAAVLLKFKVGDLIEYRSETLGRWILKKIARVDQQNGVYDIANMDGTLMKSNADPGRVRKQQDLRASVSEDLRVKVGEHEGNGIRGAGVVVPVGHMEDGQVKPARISFGGKLDYSIYIRVDEPSTRWTSRGTFEVSTHVGSFFSATCAFETVTMTCRTFGLHKQEAKYTMKIVPQTHAIFVYFDLTRTQALAGGRCDIEAVALVSGAIQPGDNGKFRSYHKYLTLPR